MSKLVILAPGIETAVLSVSVSVAYAKVPADATAAVTNAANLAA
jgi:hypothetical protein